MLNLEALKSLGYNAVLLLQSGEIFYGNSLGKRGIATGEVCLNTALTGYQHTITDPSFAEQIIIFTAPHIGNIGFNDFDNESKKAFCKGIVIRENVIESDHFLRTKPFSNWLEENNIVGITGLDTRKLVHIIKKNGAQNVIICSDISEIDAIDKNGLDVLLSNTPAMNSMELTKIASGFHIDIENNPKNNTRNNDDDKNIAKKITIIDFGVKGGIIKNISKHLKHFDIEVIKSEPGFAKKISSDTSGIVLSNGPGDPKATFNYLKEDFSLLFKLDVPVLGICLGHQILALQFNCRTKKMETGHRGANHPVLNLDTNKVEITSQNHGFMVDQSTLSDQVEVTHISLFDHSIEGIRIKGKPIFSVQYHPEGSPGPNDSLYIFKKFSDVVNS